MSVFLGGHIGGRDLMNSGFIGTMGTVQNIMVSIVVRFGCCNWIAVNSWGRLTSTGG